MASTAHEIEHPLVHPHVQISFVHEYVHFLQLVTSVAGIRLLADLVDLGVRGGLLLSGTIGLGDVVRGYHKIRPLLEGLGNRAWIAHPGVEARRNETMDELEALLQPMTFPCEGNPTPWTIAHQVVCHRTFEEPIWGFVVSGNTGPEFRPFSVGFLAETMARRLDRWFAQQVDPNHQWDRGRDESEFYNGLLTLLSRGGLGGHLDGANLEEIAVVIAGLALATPRPDEATMLMLKRLARPIHGGVLVQNVATALRDELVSRRLHHADHYNEAISDIMWGAAIIMDRTEYLDIHRRLVQVHEAANRILQNPTMFVRSALAWNDVRAWMSWFPPPPVVAADEGRAMSVDGVSCESFCTPFLSLVEMRLLAG